MPRILVALLTCSLSVAPIAVHARPKAGAATSRQAEPDFDRAAFSAEYKQGDAAREAGRFAEAARLWLSAARHMPETRTHRDDRAGLFNDIAAAFLRANEQAEDEALLREAVDSLEHYISGFEAAYPGEAVDPEIVAVRAELQRRLTALKEARRPPPAVVDPEPAPRPVATPVADEPRPGRGLQIAGGLGLGLGAVVWLATLPAGYGKVKDIRAGQIEAGCHEGSTESVCVQGEAGVDDNRTQVISGWVTGSLLLAAGLSMLVAGTLRRSGRSTVTPTASSTSIGLTWQGRF